jgi:hypothetical protein
MMVAVLAGGAFANIPDPALSKVPPVLIMPNNPNLLPPPVGPNSLGYTVEVIGNQGPVNNALVEVDFSHAAWLRIAKCNAGDGSSVFCGGIVAQPTTPAPHYICTATTGIDGKATFQISGGACILATAVNPYTVEIRANGVVLANDITILSPDVVNDNGQTSAQTQTSNCLLGQTSTGLSDAVFHTSHFSGATFNRCSDFNDNDISDLADAVIATQSLTSGNACTCTAP